MTKKEAKQIQEWLAIDSQVKAELLHSKDSSEMELHLSRPNSDGEFEYLIFALPLEFDKNSELI